MKIYKSMGVIKNAMIDEMNEQQDPENEQPRKVKRPNMQTQPSTPNTRSKIAEKLLSLIEFRRRVDRIDHRQISPDVYELIATVEHGIGSWFKKWVHWETHHRIYVSGDAIFALSPLATGNLTSIMGFFDAIMAVAKKHEYSLTNNDYDNMLFAHVGEDNTGDGVRSRCIDDADLRLREDMVFVLIVSGQSELTDVCDSVEYYPNFMRTFQYRNIYESY